MKVTYTSSNGQSFDLLDFDFAKLEKADFHSYSWDKEVVARDFGEIVNKFKKSAQAYDCTFKFRGSVSRRKAQIEAFHFCTEYDIAHKTAGKLTWGDCYINCYMIKADTYPDGDGSNYTTSTGTFYCPYPFWIQEQTIEIYPNPDISEVAEDAKGYEPSTGRYGYTYSYAGGRGAINIDVDHYADSDFKLIAYGPATEVQFAINNHVYRVNYPLRSNQYMVIDSRQNTPVDRQCYVVNESGVITNVFDYRDPTSELFKKIPCGSLILNYARTYGLNLTIYKERSEPIANSI